MPEMRARTSETRVGEIRPGSSLTRARDCGRTVKVPTSGSPGFAAAVAAVGSLQLAKSGAIAANIKTMHADRLCSPDIESIAPVQSWNARIDHSRRCRKCAVSALELTVDGDRIKRLCCDAIRFRGGPMSHNAIALKYRRLLLTHWIVSRFHFRDQS